MMKKLLGVVFAITMVLMLGCGEQKKAPPEPSLLQDISGVWKVKGETTLVTIDSTDKKTRLLFNDEFVPVTVGAIDEENHTVNFNVTLAETGKPAVWTVRQIWNGDKSAFHLQITMHDGTQGEFSFVRKISTDDLNHIASLEAPAKTDNTATQAAAAAAQPAQKAEQATQEASPMKVSVPATQPAVEAAPSTAVSAPAEVAAATQTTAVSAAQTTAFAPSFDCAKVSSGPERLICGSPKLAALDVELSQAYKRQMELASDKAQLKADQIEWRKTERDACSSEDCVAQAYRSRIDDLVAVNSHLSKPAEFQ